jgi:simple sugar transport system ATP-binding protein
MPNIFREDEVDYLLRTEGLSKVLSNGTLANKQVDFAVAKGEILGLVGENGAGKSTLMKLLYGEESPSSGRSTSMASPSAFLLPRTRSRPASAWCISTSCWFLP